MIFSWFSHFSLLISTFVWFNHCYWGNVHCFDFSPISIGPAKARRPCRRRWSVQVLVVHQRDYDGSMMVLLGIVWYIINGNMMGIWCELYDGNSLGVGVMLVILGQQFTVLPFENLIDIYIYMYIDIYIYIYKLYNHFLVKSSLPILIPGVVLSEVRKTIHFAEPTCPTL